jgi:putative lipoic acid-binding regulatory protein
MSNMPNKPPGRPEEFATDRVSLLTFPCAFPIKVMGERRDGFAEEIIRSIAGETGPLQESQIEMRTSRQAKYLGLTITVNAESQAQLDRIYRTLTSHPWVKVVL